MVVKTLTANVRCLVDSETSRLEVTPVERLARTQALLLYQVIRLLDGDVMLRAQGEMDTPVLHAWIHDLCSLRDNLGDLARLGNRSMRHQPPVDWQASRAA